MLHSLSGYKYTTRRTAPSTRRFTAVGGTWTVLYRGEGGPSHLALLKAYSGWGRENQRGSEGRGESCREEVGAMEEAISGAAAGVKGGAGGGPLAEWLRCAAAGLGDACRRLSVCPFEV